MTRVIHDNSGVDTQLTVADLNGDESPDAVIANRLGILVRLQKKQRLF
jgi:hypothetical protein